MADLCDPEKNDREWFKARDPLWRYVEKNWNNFVTTLLEKLMDVDETVPLMPHKDLTYRIYRDVRLCLDKVRISSSRDDIYPVPISKKSRF